MSHIGNHLENVLTHGKPLGKRAHTLKTTWKTCPHLGNPQVMDALRRNGTLFECVQRPGDVMFVPMHWGHATVNEGPAATLSVSLKFVFAEE